MSSLCLSRVSMESVKANYMHYIEYLFKLKHLLSFPPEPQPINPKCGIKMIFRVRWFPRNTMNNNIPDEN